MTRPVTLLSSLLIGFLLSGNAAHAAPIPSWRFEAEAITAGPREELHIFGILSNDQAATDPFLIGQIISGVDASAPSETVFPLLSGYEIQLRNLLFVQPIPLPPGESTRIEWATLIPRGSVLPGTYGISRATFNFGAVLDSTNLFVIMVVPEPSAVLLIGIGLTGLALLRRRQT